MKQLAVVAVVLVVIAAGMPVVVGTVTESRVRQQAEMISANGVAEVTVRDYERGWRASTAKVDLRLTELYQDRIKQVLIQNQSEPVSVPAIEEALARTLTLAVEVSHGPVLASDGVGLGLASAVIRLDPETEGLDKLLLKLGVPYLFEIRTRSGFSSVSEFETDIPPMVFEDADGTSSFSGFTSEGTYDFANRHVVVEGRMDMIEVTSELVTTTAETLTLSGDYRMVSTYVWEGPVELALERMSILNATPNGPAFIEANNIGFRALTTLNETRDRLAMNASYYIDSAIGDDLTLTDAKIDLAMRSVDVAAFSAYHRLSQEMVFEPDATEAVSPELEQALYQLLVAEPGIDIGPVNFIYNGQPFEAVVRIQADNEMLPPQVAFSMMDPSLWTRLFTVEAEMDIAQDMAERLAIEAMKYQLRSTSAISGEEMDPEALNAMAESQGPGMLLLLVAQGMVETSQTGYRTAVSYRNGGLEVNGRQIPLGPQF